MKELKFEELTLEQKLGMVMTGAIVREDGLWNDEMFKENLEFILELIRKRSLGAVWISPRIKKWKEAMKAVKAVADYPILIITDAEPGIGEHLIGRHNAIGSTASEELAYTFGKVTGVTAREMGYNVVCDPVLDMCDRWETCGSNSRSLGSDKYKVTKLAMAESKGLHDGGVLNVAKHYPGGKDKLDIDSHMAPNYCDMTKEELLEYDLYPYVELIKEGLIDGIMTSHKTYIKIDAENPGSLSKKVNDFIREQGFETGFTITDALDMMSIRAKYGDVYSKGLAIAGGNELCLPWIETSEKAYNSLIKCYEEGIFTQERLDEAVKRVLWAQHKVLSLSQDAIITDKDIEDFAKINRSIYAKTDDGIPVALDKNGRYFFAVVVKNETEINDQGKVSVDTFTNEWYNPELIIKKLESLFPNSAIRAISQFPTPHQNESILIDSLEYDDVIFINFAEAPAYAGSDHITHRMVALMNAFTLTNRASTIVHFGNPYVLEDAPHMKRILIGGISTDSTMAGLEVLAGNYNAEGVLTYNVNFK